jgi:serine phosphatase RsbU (regulator of sigma subunit)/tetratricopeptide (TPR) repeat protein
VILCHGQNLNKLDSLRIRLSQEKSDTGKVILYYKIAYELQFKDIEQSSEYAKKAYDEALKLKYKKGTGNSLIQLGNIEQVKGNYQQSEEYYLQALKILTRINDQTGMANGYNNLGIISHNRNDYSKALDYYRKALEINRSINRKSGEATSLFCIGIVFENQVKYDSAIVFYLEAQKISESIGDLKLIAQAKICLANVYFMMENYARSYEYNNEAIALYVKTGNDYGLMKVYISLGQTVALLDSLKQAIWFYRQALKIGYKIKNPNDIAWTILSIAQLYEDQGNNDSSYVNYKRAYDLYSGVGNKENTVLSLISLARIQNLRRNHLEAKKQLLEALNIAKGINYPSALIEAYREMAMTLSYLNDFEEAFYYLYHYSDTKDSVMTVEKQKQILELQTRYETEKKEKENTILRKDQQILQTTRNSLIVGALLLILIVLLIFRSLSIKKRDNLLLRQQKEEIARQKDIVEDQKTSITDSIRYAKRIQSAMMPPDELIKNSLPESFILYLPRDIVSGDFYWLRQVNDSRLIVCAADCTGHGVPGAFMSMLGISLLTDIFNTNLEKINNNEFSPADILNELRRRVKNSLRQTGQEGEARDGMDMSLCFIDRNTGIVHFSGANNPIYFVDNGNLTELKAIRNPIGIYLNEMSFVTHEARLPKGAVLYMFSDGFSDQIGSDGGKFLSKHFKQLLAQISNLPMDEIKEKLHKTHLEWRKEEEQVDDILVIGIKV